MPRFARIAWLCAAAVVHTAAPAGSTGPPGTFEGAALPTGPNGRVIVKFRDESRVRLRAGSLVSLAGRDLAGVEAALAPFGHPRPERLVTVGEDAVDRLRERAERRSGRDLPDMNGYYEIEVGPGQVDALLAALRPLEVVQTAYRAPEPVPPPADIPPTTPDFESGQGYLDPAPGGVDARTAWTLPGGHGEGVFVIDIEYDWRDTHEDLDAALGQKLCYVPNGNFTEHGTAVLGEMASGDNGYGVTGIVSGATFGMVTQDPVGMSNSVSRAITCATPLLGPGDVMLLETQASGPLGLLPSEWNQDVFDAVSIATAAGITVVAAAGNGNVDLDDPVHGGAFDRSVRDSGAIIVGAGAAPGSGQPDRSRLSFSTYGSRVDVQGWGHLVTTAGYGDLFAGGGDVRQYYTAAFNGTSSASPMVASAAAALQGVQMAQGGEPLDPLEVRRILTDTGSPQQDGPFAGHIGPRPDLSAAVAALAHLLVTQVIVDDPPPLGDADGILEPGETATLRITLRNAGAQTATGIQGFLGAADPVLRVTGPSADWPDLAASTSAESLPPHHTVTLQPGAACGIPLGLSLDLTSVPYDATGNVQVYVGRRQGQAAAGDVPITIPKKSKDGIVSTLTVTDADVLEDVEVSVDITHGDIGELTVLLTSPSGTSVTLHDKTGAGTADLQTTYDRDTTPDGPGTMSDFDGEPSQGTWTLTVLDDQAGPVPPGTLNAWSVELLAAGAFECTPPSCPDPVPGEMGDSLRVDLSGTDDLAFSWDPLGGATAYRIWRSELPGMDPDAFVGETAGTGLVESGGASDPTALVYYQVRAVNSCEWEGP